MTKSSNKRVARVAAKKAAAKAMPKPKPNGLLKLKMSSELKYKLLVMHERQQKLSAQKATLEAEIGRIEAQLLNAQLLNDRVVEEITESLQGRLKGQYSMEKADFDEGVAFFARKKPESKDERAS